MLNITEIINSKESAEKFIKSLKPEEQTAALKLSIKYLLSLKKAPLEAKSAMSNFALAVMGLSSAASVGSCATAVFFFIYGILAYSYALYVRHTGYRNWCGFSSLLVTLNTVIAVYNAIPFGSKTLPDQIVPNVGQVTDVLQVGGKGVNIGRIGRNESQWIAPNALQDNGLQNATAFSIFGEKKNIFGSTTTFSQYALGFDIVQKNVRILCVGPDITATEILESVKVTKPFEPLSGPYGETITCTSWNPENILDGAFIPDPKKAASIVPLRKTKELTGKVSVHAMSAEEVEDISEEETLIKQVVEDLESTEKFQAQAESSGCQVTESILSFKGEDGQMKTTFLSTFRGCYGQASTDHVSRF